jgi:hypothetical protein
VSGTGDLDALKWHPDPRVRNYARIGVWLIRAFHWGVVTGGLGVFGGLFLFPIVMPREPRWMFFPWELAFTVGSALVGAALPLAFAGWHFALHVLAEALDVLRGK